jgi:general secretion pathway protein K
MPREVKTADRGFTMIVVLWVIALLTLILMGFLRSTGTHTGIAANAVTSARAEALADAGIHLAVLDLMQAAGNRTAAAATARNSVPTTCRAGPGETITVRIQDAAGRVDLNAANHALLAALLAGVGASAPEASAGAAAIIDFRDRDNEPLAGGAEAADYTASGLKFTPKNAPFDTAEELERVFGLTLQRIELLLPHVTVHSGMSGVDPLAASPTLIALLQAGQHIVAPAGYASRGPGGRLPPEFAGTSPRQTFILTSAAETQNGGRYVREAIVEVISGRTQNYAFRTWKRGETFSEQKPTATEPPACTGLTG